MCHLDGGGVERINYVPVDSSIGKESVRSGDSKGSLGERSILRSQGRTGKCRRRKGQG